MTPTKTTTSTQRGDPRGRGRAGRAPTGIGRPRRPRRRRRGTRTRCSGSGSAPSPPRPGRLPTLGLQPGGGDGTRGDEAPGRHRGGHEEHAREDDPCCRGVALHAGQRSRAGCSAGGARREPGRGPAVSSGLVVLDRGGRRTVRWRRGSTRARAMGGRCRSTPRPDDRVPRGRRRDGCVGAAPARPGSPSGRLVALDRSPPRPRRAGASPRRRPRDVESGLPGRRDPGPRRRRGPTTARRHPSTSRSPWTSTLLDLRCRARAGGPASAARSARSAGRVLRHRRSAVVPTSGAHPRPRRGQRPASGLRRRRTAPG